MRHEQQIFFLRALQNSLSLIAFAWVLLAPACQHYDDSTVRIGAILGMTGNSGSLGEDTRNGLQLAIDEQNARGGLLGKKIELLTEDSKTDAKTATDIAHNMLEVTKGKPIAVYTQSSVVSLPVKPVAEKTKTPMFAISGAEQLCENSRFVFRNWANPQVAAAEIAEFLSDSLHCVSVGIFYCNNDYGKSMEKFLAAECAARGMTVPISETFNEKDGDYKSLISAKLAGKQIQSIYTVGLGAGLGTLIKQIRENGYEGHLISDITAPYPNVLAAAGESIKGMYYLDFAFNPASMNSSMQAYATQFRQKFNKDPLNFSVVSYDAMRLLFKAVENAGSFDPEKIAAELNKLSAFPGVFGNVDVSQNEIKYALNIKRF